MEPDIKIYRLSVGFAFSFRIADIDIEKSWVWQCNQDLEQHSQMQFVLVLRENCDIIYIILSAFTSQSMHIKMSLSNSWTIDMIDYVNLVIHLKF